MFKSEIKKFINMFFYVKFHIFFTKVMSGISVQK